MSYHADDDGDIWDDETNMVHGPELIAGRINHIQDICRRAIEHDRSIETSENHWTDRHWLAQSVLNIMGGNIDTQIISELTQAELRDYRRKDEMSMSMWRWWKRRKQVRRINDAQRSFRSYT